MSHRPFALQALDIVGMINIIIIIIILIIPTIQYQYSTVIYSDVHCYNPY